MIDENLEALLFSMSGCSTIVLNFMKTIALKGAAFCLDNPENQEDLEMADDIINDIIDGYQFEDHSIQ